mmetsp:Transcript_31807/g.38464  ORF Transcript_31807/g.38464 Transcript_31807/m.38464 type:complete len:133 (-) Transcript_31807:591-989(-)|eukprot:CAMPEP_0197854604 /NCGR_PEP_ID=MMETSP1438-20131217/24971_1 /TAXON_ID=1461541 /ORGANISM="Pterosperma sp., Strain CCMP1384" /LENGTH=132 /DNA_ID=CAMNT_0043469393 /DNA_START=194 /DNA_END=592 /DNA_ORIENTATION=+
MAPTIEVKALDVSPNNCPLGEAISLQMTFTTSEDLAGAHWEIKYMVDMAAKRQIVELGKTELTNYAAGENSVTYTGGAMDFSGVKKSLLKNVGLLLACLMHEGEEVIQVSMVTQVMKNPEGELIRTVLSPLE